VFYGGNYFAIAHDFQGLPAGLGVIWSLAVEEHFYLLFPPLAALLLAWRPQRAALAIALLCALVLAWRAWRLAHGASVDAITMSTDTRVDSILVGCGMAFWRNPWLSPPEPAHIGRDWALLALGLAVLVATLLVRDETFRLTARFTLQSLAVALLIHRAVARPASRALRWLSAAPLVYLGSISYTVYLCHHLILEGLQRAWPDAGLLFSAPWLLRTALAVALTWVVAEAMRRSVEQPCAAWRRRLHAARAPASSLHTPSRTP
jgi:peptidoglycan/LPS O-acetylase OafA/YrhL